MSIHFDTNADLTTRATRPVDLALFDVAVRALVAMLVELNQAAHPWGARRAAAPPRETPRVHIRFVVRTPAGMGAVIINHRTFADDALTCLVGRPVKVVVSEAIHLALVSLMDGTQVCAAEPVRAARAA